MRKIAHTRPLNIYALPVLILLILAGCTGPKPSDNAVLVRSADMVPAVIVLEYGDQIEILQLPEDRSVYTGLSEEILTVWSDGFLRKRDSMVAWFDLKRETGRYDPNPGVDLTSWDTPVAVNSEQDILYVFAHTVAPSREIYAHYIDGRPSEQVGQLVADEIETLIPLPSNGWPAFYVDRPGQATALTVDRSPSRKMRIYGGRIVGGEFPDVLGIFFLENDVVIDREADGWILFDLRNGRVNQRTMSLGQIPGKIRPLARIEDTILIASDEVSDDGETVLSSVLYAYGPYTRMLDEIWDPGASGEPVRILSLAVSGADDYYILTEQTGGPGKIQLVRFNGGNVSDIAEITTPEEFSKATVYLLAGPVLNTEIPVTGESVDLSAGNASDITTE